MGNYDICRKTGGLYDLLLKQTWWIKDNFLGEWENMGRVKVCFINEFI